MELSTKLGKIKSIDLIIDDGRFGLHVDLKLDGGSYGVADFSNWSWSTCVKVIDGVSQWTEKDRDELNAKTMKFINKLLLDAKQNSLQNLTDIPIEATFKDRNLLQSFRILTEVL